jgi:phage tail-like protein
MPQSRKSTARHSGAVYYVLEVDGLTAAEFERLAGLGTETDVITYKDGDEIGVRKRAGRSWCANIVLRRLVPASSAARRKAQDDSRAALCKWRAEVLAGTAKRRSGALSVFAGTRSLVARYAFAEAWPSRYTLANDDALDADRPVEEIELVVERLELAQP